MYEKIIKEATREKREQLKKTREYLEEDNNKYMLQRYLTEYRNKQLENGEITKEEALEIAWKKAVKENQKELENKIKHIREVYEQEEIKEITINVEWARNRTWGMNPTAVVWTSYAGRTEGRASGCGYDKESSAIAQALNKNKNILKLLYDYKEKELEAGNQANNETLFGYGSGYGVLPYFEGGVGVNSHIRIFENLGFKVKQTHGKLSDSYIIYK